MASPIKGLLEHTCHFDGLHSFLLIYWLICSVRKGELTCQLINKFALLPAVGWMYICGV